MRQFFLDQVILFLSLVILAFIVVDSFINLLPNGKGTVQCFIKNNSVTSGQQSYVNEYCSNQVPAANYRVPILIFSQGLFSVLLHYSWYSMVLYRKNALGNDSTQKGCKYLVVGYVARTLIQALVSMVVMIITMIYEYSDLLSFDFNDSFPCTIDVDYWHPVGRINPVQCIYISVAVNDVFLVFYGVMSAVISIAAVIGTFSICLRSGLDKNTRCCHFKCPSDSEICSYCIDESDPKKQTPNDSTPKPNNSTPTPNNSTPTPNNSTPTPNNSTPTTNNSTSTPNDSTSTPNDSTPIPNNSTPTPNNSTPTPNNSTPAPKTNSSQC